MFIFKQLLHRWGNWMKKPLTLCLQVFPLYPAGSISYTCTSLKIALDYFSPSVKLAFSLTTHSFLKSYPILFNTKNNCLTFCFQCTSQILPNLAIEGHQGCSKHLFSLLSHSKLVVLCLPNPAPIYFSRLICQ